MGHLVRHPMEDWTPEKPFPYCVLAGESVGMMSGFPTAGGRQGFGVAGHSPRLGDLPEMPESDLQASDHAAVVIQLDLELLLAAAETPRLDASPRAARSHV